MFTEEVVGNNKRKYLCWLLIGVGVYAVLPFLFLAQYNQPSADDFTLAVRDSNSPLSFVLKDVYLNWSGRYLAPVISRLNPLIYNPHQYELFPILLIVAFISSVIILVRELLKHSFSFTEILAVSSLFIYLIFSQTPSISEAFFWYSGSCIYQTANIVTLLLITILVKLNKAHLPVNKHLYIFLAASCCVFIIGCNEISMIIVSTIVYSTAIVEYLNTKSLSRRSILLCLICLVCSAIVVFAPGNFSRIGDPMFYNKSVLWTAVGAASITLLNLLKWGTSLLMVTLVYLILIERKRQSLKVQVPTRMNIKFIILSFCMWLILLQLFIVYTAGGGNLGRIENNVYFFSILAYALMLHLVINRFANHQLFRFLFYKAVLVVSVTLFLLNVFDVENNITSAYVDLLSGRAKKYNAELNERLVRARNCKEDTCYVPPISTISKSLFVTDIRTADDTIFLWINRSYANYYNTAYVLPSGSPPLIEPNIEIIKKLGKEIRKNIVKKYFHPTKQYQKK